MTKERTSSRAMSRPNMLKATERIRRDLATVIGAAPNLRGNGQVFYEDELEARIERLMQDVAWLWG